MNITPFDVTSNYIKTLEIKSTFYTKHDEIFTDETFCIISDSGNSFFNFLSYTFAREIKFIYNARSSTLFHFPLISFQKIFPSDFDSLH